MRDSVPCSTVSRCFAPFRKTFLYSEFSLLFRGYFAMQEVSYLSSSMDIFFCFDYYRNNTCHEKRDVYVYTVTKVNDLSNGSEQTA